MAKELVCTVLENKPAAADIFTLRLGIPEPVQMLPGQFVNIAVPGMPLRRPISITSVKNGEIRLTYRIAGAGTEKLSAYDGKYLSIIAPLGNGFTLPEPDSEILVIGGGIGTAPLPGLIETALERNCRVTAVFGFKEPGQALFTEELSKLPVRMFYCYDSLGENVVTVLQREQLENIRFYACGPLAMMKAVDKVMRADGEFSLESRMGCGFGACMGCSAMMRSGMQRICKDGPVFQREEIIWNSLR